MRPVIDRDGRLFGVINVVDALVMIGLVIVAYFLYQGYRLVSMPTADRPQVPASEKLPEEWVTVLIGLRELTYEELKMVHPGDREMAGGGSEILRLEAVGPFSAPTRVLPVIASLRCVREGSRLSFNGVPVQMGQEVKLKLTEWSSNGEIWKVLSPAEAEIWRLRWDGARRQSINDTARTHRIEVRVYFERLPAELASVVAKGDRWVHPLTGETLVVRVVEKQGSATRSESIQGMTVTCQVQLECTELHGELFFGRDQIVHVGVPFLLMTDRYRLEGVITDLEDLTGAPRRWVQ